MKIERSVTYRSDDGTEFGSQAECLIYEAKTNPLKLRQETVASILNEDSDAAKSAREFLQRLARLARLGEIERGVYVPHKGKRAAEKAGEPAEDGLKQAAE